MRVARERLLGGRRAIDPSEQFSLFWRVNWGGFRGRGLLGNNSNLVIRWRVWGCIFSLIIEIVLCGGAILMVEGRFGGWATINPVTLSPAPA